MTVIGEASATDIAHWDGAEACTAAGLAPAVVTR
jgi:hypothetical protein